MKNNEHRSYLWSLQNLDSLFGFRSTLTGKRFVYDQFDVKLINVVFDCFVLFCFVCGLSTRVVQRLVESIKTRKQISLVKLALRPGFLNLIRDLNGNHVIQRCLKCLSTKDNEVKIPFVTLLRLKK